MRWQSLRQRYSTALTFLLVTLYACEFTSQHHKGKPQSQA